MTNLEHETVEAFKKLHTLWDQLPADRKVVLACVEFLKEVKLKDPECEPLGAFNAIQEELNR